MKKVLVFGGSGFLGSHVADKLSNSNFDVTIIDIKKSNYLKKNQKFINEDIKDLKKNSAIFKNCNYLFNFAGIADIDESLKFPEKTITNNILNNFKLLEIVKKNNIKKYIFASSVYAGSNSGNYYSLSKNCCEDYIILYSKINSIKYTILRFGSLYGDRSGIKNGLYQFIYSALLKNKIEFNGSPESIREFINVEDAALSTIDILKKDFDNKIITLTGHQLLKIKDLHEMIKEILNKKNLKIVYKSNKSNTHYRLTPYSIEEKISKKYNPKLYTDLGEGLLQLSKKILHEKK